MTPVVERLQLHQHDVPSSNPTSELKEPAALPDLVQPESTAASSNPTSELKEPAAPVEESAV